MKSEKIGWIAVTGFVLIVLLTLCRMSSADFSVPWTYSGDALLTSMMIQNMAESGWIYENSRLGMPFGHQIYDFPTTDTLHLLIIRVLLWLVADWAVTLNLFYVLTFFLTAWTGYWAGRKVGLHRHWAVTVAVLYAFLPYHFLRGQGHLFLAAYFTVPPMMVVCLWLATGKFRRFSQQKVRIVIGVAAAFLVSLSGIYYAFFACFFLLAAALIGWVQHRRVLAPVLALALVAVICLGVGAQLVPHLWYNVQEGRNAALAQRIPAEAEIYGLKITQLLLPTLGHRTAWFNRAASRYNEWAPLVNENRSAALGMVGAIGFLALLGWILLQFRCGKPKPGSGLTSLSQLNLAALLLATIGGGGAVFALAISPQIRAYNRISIFIGLISLWGIALILQHGMSRLCGARGRNWSRIAAFVILVIGVFDQVPLMGSGPSPVVRSEFESDRAFFRQLESELPAAALVFQFPYMPFPENPPIHHLHDYDHLRAYLQSRNLRWSYAAMKGRFADQWQADASRLPLPALLNKLALAGFGGVYVDRNGYEDGAKKLENELRSLLGVTPLQSKNGRLLFFPVQAYAEGLRKQQGEQWWQASVAQELRPIVAEWGKGFSVLEKDASHQWRWADRKAELFLRNFGPETRKVQITLVAASGYPDPSRLSVTGADGVQQYSIDSRGQKIVLDMNLPPGRTRLTLETDAPRVQAPTDPRSLYFRVMDFRLTQPR